MSVGAEVRHVLRPSLGVGIVQRVISPDVVMIWWEKVHPDTMTHIWGHHKPSADLVPV